MKNSFFQLFAPAFLLALTLSSCAEDPQVPSFVYSVQGQAPLQFSGEFYAREESQDTAVLQILAPATLSVADAMTKSQEESLCGCKGLKVEILAMAPDSAVLAGGKVSQQIINGLNGPSTYWVIQLPAFKREKEKKKA